MKRLLTRIQRGRSRSLVASGDGRGESRFFSSMFQEPPEDPQARASWRARAAEVGAVAFDRAAGTALFGRAWSADRHVMALKPDELQRMSQYIDFVKVPASQEVIGQDELGDYMLIVLEGTIAVDRVQPWGTRARLAEAHAGDMLGEMSLLDAGARFSSCLTLTPSVLGVVDARRLDEMITAEPRLGVALLASLSRRLSLRLRNVSARLSALLSQN